MEPDDQYDYLSRIDGILSNANHMKKKYEKPCGEVVARALSVPSVGMVTISSKSQ